MLIKKISTSVFAGQKPGTSGLRKKVKEFQKPGYLENFVQSIFNTVMPCHGKTLVIGGDGRFYNKAATQIIIRMAIANGFSKLIVGQDGILSTPAASNLIRKNNACGGIILSASHNPGGPEDDFGIKFNAANGGPAPEGLTEKIYQNTLTITQYLTIEEQDVDLSHIGVSKIGDAEIQIIDPVVAYADLMQSIFDFDLIANFIQENKFKICIDTMHAVNGPYAIEIFEKRLAAKSGTVINAVPLSDFGGGHPDPNLVHAHEMVALLNGPDALDFGAATDGDGDRNMVYGKEFYLNPCDSLAILTANAHLIPGYSEGIKGVARSMPTSRAVDRVAKDLGIDCYETPTGWKFFGNLLDAGKISICGEESFGTGSDHVREKDGLWAVLFWLNLIAVKKLPLSEIVQAHWAQFGRDYFTRHDYEGVDSAKAQQMFTELRDRLGSLSGQEFGGLQVESADDFSYTDPVDNSVSEHQGIRIYFNNGGRLVLRLSGTGTQGATLRVYLDQYVNEPDMLRKDTQKMLMPLIAATEKLVSIEKFTGRTEPTVIT